MKQHSDSESLYSQVETTLNYVKRTRRKPVLSQDEDAFIEFDPRTVSIQDVRPRLGELSVHSEGFAVAPLESQVENFYDDEQVRRTYYPEIEEFAMCATGASEIYIFNHAQRNDLPADSSRATNGNTVHFVHNDFTTQAADQALNFLNTTFGTNLDVEGDRRIWFLNTWMPISEPVRQCPLAICSATSIDHVGDTVTTELRLPDVTFDIFTLTHNKKHRWAYVSEMTPTECVIFKGYDSEPACKNAFTSHSSFKIPDESNDLPARESIEVRLVAVF